MDALGFDSWTRALTSGLSRRNLSASGVGALLVGIAAAHGAAKKKKKKKSQMCFQGQTVLATKKKRKKLLKQGATNGACAACTPTCLGKACSADDGCGGTCTRCDTRSFCDGGTCAACSGNCRGDTCNGDTLRAALNAGGTVQACPGRYTGVFALSADVTLLGAGDGADPVSNTILDAQGQGRTLDVPAGVTAALLDVRITGGDTNGASGGGVRVNGALEMTRCTVHQNDSGGTSGGGIANFGSLEMTDCTVSKNTGATGGGILHDSSTTALTLTGCTVTENTATTGAGIHHTSNQALILNSCTISGNTSTLGSGGLLLPTASQTAQITATAITDNTSGGDGGGIWNGGAITFDSTSSVTGNTAIGGVGAGIYNYNVGSVTLNGATVSGNTPATDECFGC